MSMLPMDHQGSHQYLCTDVHADEDRSITLNQSGYPEAPLPRKQAAQLVNNKKKIKHEVVKIRSDKTMKIFRLCSRNDQTYTKIDSLFFYSKYMITNQSLDLFLFIFFIFFEPFFLLWVELYLQVELHQIFHNSFSRNPQLCLFCGIKPLI